MRERAGGLSTELAQEMQKGQGSVLGSQFSVGAYKLHGEWKNFTGSLVPKKVVGQKSNGVSDFGKGGERKEFCNENG
jgi:hypothetical protein